MDKIYFALIRFFTLIILLFFISSAKAIVITSLQGGMWNNTNTWDCGCIPTSTDDVIIASGHYVRLGGSTTINNITINTGGIMNNNAYILTVTGNYVVNGDHVGNAGTELTGVGTIIDGIGTIHSAELKFLNGNKTILSSARLTKAFGIITVKSGVTINNFGAITVGSDIVGDDSSARWVNKTNASLNISGNIFENGGTFYASDSGNTVRYYGVDSQYVKKTYDSTYYHLILDASGLKILGSNLDVKGDVMIYGSNFDLSGYNLNLQGDWYNSGILIPTLGTVIFDGSADQSITNIFGETFYNLKVDKISGEVFVTNRVTVENALELVDGNIDLDTTRLTLGTSQINEGTLIYTSGIIIGEFERWIGSSGVPYLFPVGSDTNYCPAQVTFNVFTGGSLIAEFRGSDPGLSGLPVLDDTTVINNTFVEGRWDLTTANGLTSTDFDLALTGNGFTSFPIIPMTRILSRINAANLWTTAGSHLNASGNTAYRTGLDLLYGQFALGDTSNCLGPLPLTITGANSVCVNDIGQIYSVVNTPSSIYAWSVSGGTITSGQGTNLITVDWGPTGMIGEVKVYETNLCTRGPNSVLDVSLHPFTTSAISGKENVSEFTLGEAYSIIGETGYSYIWSIIGGTISSGQGTDTVLVDWGASATGKVCVVGLNGCGSADTVSMEINIYVPIISVKTGDWLDNSTWNCNCIPMTSSNVKIMNTHVVDIHDPTTVNHFEIVAGGVLDVKGGQLEVQGDLTVDGYYLRDGDLILSGAGTTIDGVGQITNSGLIKITGGNKVILSTAYLLKSSNSFHIDGPFTVTNYGNITLENDLTASHINANWINSTNATLNIKGDLFPTLGNLIVNATNNIVEYTGGANQVIKQANPKTYYELTINKSVSDASLEGNTNVTVLNLVSGKLILGSRNLKISETGVVNGGGINSYVQADSTGEMRKRFNTLETFTFPIGDVDDYSPFTITLNNGTIFDGGDEIRMRVTDLKHPNMSSPGHITRYWTIKAKHFDEINYDVSYEYVDADIVGAESTLLSQFWDGAWTSYQPVDAANNRLFTLSGLTQMPDKDAFTGGGGSLLPIELLSFSAKPSKDNVILEWSTSIEINNDYFIVERAQSDNQFYPISKIDGFGNSYVKVNYEDIDHKPLSGLSYYRLKQVDIDGRFKYSDPVSVVFNRPSHFTFRIYPNPILERSSLSIDMENFSNVDAVDILLLDHLGREVFSGSYEPDFEGSITCKDIVNAIPAGIYYIALTCNDKTYKHKLVVSGNIPEESEK